jgi:hypothetical protein
MALDLYGVAIDNYGNSYATGYLQGTETIGMQTYTSTGLRDMALVNADTAGASHWLWHTIESPGGIAWDGPFAPIR